MTAPRILGRVLLGERQGKELFEGAKLFIPTQQLRKTLRGQVVVGGLMWVQEPFYHCLPKNKWTCQTINTIIPGPRFGMKFPAWLQRLPHKAVYNDGTRMPRHASRATLVIESLGEQMQGVWCVVRMVQIDAFVKSAAEVKPCA